MGNFPPIEKPQRIPIAVPTPGDLMDHHFQGQPVLPAVAAMETLASCAREEHPQLDLRHIINARFDKFLPMDPGADHIDAFAEFQPNENGTIQATLLTRTKAPKAAFTRTKIHVCMTFATPGASQNYPPIDLIASLEGVCTRIEPKAIYKELVPFGPTFRNICTPLQISADGALARIETPASSPPGTSGAPLLGSGYALDAAFHAACVWAQRHRGIVAFPVAMERRIIHRATRPSSIYYGRVFPRETSGDALKFDILLVDENGQVCETAQGVHMRDVSGGRLQPPDWIRDQGGTDPLAQIRSACRALTLIELDAVAPFAPQALTSLEEKKYQKMGPKRQRSFLSARLVLKRLHRQLAGDDISTPAEQIETVYEDSPRPRFNPKGPSDSTHCSVSHNRRFAIAIADASPVGIDVETISPKALKSGRLYMHDAEQILVERSPRGDQEAAMRIWSIKEAVAKAAGHDLADTWRKVQVTSIGELDSQLSMDEVELSAQHAALGEHLFTLIKL